MSDKTLDEIEEQYNMLQDDIAAIEAGTMPIPDYGNETVCTRCAFCF